MDRRQRTSRRGTLLALLATAVLVLSGCGDSAEDEAAIMPGVEGLTLNIARSDIERAGYEDELEIVGGGTFGVVDEANWVVCEQLPAEGEPIDAQPRLVVDRQCDTGEPDESPSDEESVEEEETSDVEDIETTEPEGSDVEDEATDADGDNATSDDETSEGSESGPSVTAEEVEAKYLEHLHNNFADSFSDLCDPSYTHWACFYTGVEGDPGDYLQVNLTTDGGWLDYELADMSEMAARHWFNNIGCDFPEIDTIVVSVNGLHHNHFKSSFPSMC